MPNFPDEPLSAVRARLLDGMVGFMEGDEDGDPDECDYSQAEIDECMSIVDGYLTAIQTAPSDRWIPLIRETVESLNRLNDRCDGALIETDQREDLCQIILVAARRAGMPEQGDVTEEWREW